MILSKLQNFLTDFKCMVITNNNEIIYLENAPEFSFEYCGIITVGTALFRYIDSNGDKTTEMVTAVSSPALISLTEAQTIEVMSYDFYK